MAWATGISLAAVFLGIAVKWAVSVYERKGGKVDYAQRSFIAKNSK